jgi:hypothetical protein
MDRIDQFDVFKLGAACKAVSVLPGAPSFFDALTPLLDLKRALRALSDGQPVPVRHCRGDLEKLIKQVDVLMEDFQNEEGKLDPKKDWNQPINEFGRRRLGSLLNRFEITFAAEMRETSTYYVSRTGIFDTALLVDAATEHFPLSVREGLSEESKKDFLEAGKVSCIRLIHCRCIPFNAGCGIRSNSLPCNVSR